MDYAVRQAGADVDDAWKQDPGRAHRAISDEIAIHALEDLILETPDDAFTVTDEDILAMAIFPELDDTPLQLTPPLFERKTINKRPLQRHQPIGR